MIHSRNEILEAWNLQFWIFGQDIKNQEGNFLLNKGFKRTRARGKRLTSSSAYELSKGDFYICLWGFGVFFGVKELGGIYLSRHDLEPYFSSVWHQPKPYWALRAHRSRMKVGSHLAVQSREKTINLWQQVFQWVADYEREAALWYTKRNYGNPFFNSDERKALFPLNDLWSNISGFPEKFF
ncbi:MAG: hypothetical protein EBQ92_14235 [Proteobacteria bacterium]|nr:hypothetical protein [Pseudomonadota bacterium]